MKKTASIAVLMILAASSWAATNLPSLTASELLSRCTKTLDKTHTSFVTRSKTHVHYDNKDPDPAAASMNGERDKFLIKEQRTDGPRIKTITEMWYGPEARFANSESRRQYASQTCDGYRRYDHVRPYNGAGRVTVFEGYSEKSQALREFRDHELACSDPAAQCFGYLLGDVERYDRIIRKAGPARVSVKKASLDEADHYVIDAITPNGKYEIWLNPAKGYHFSKAVVVRKPGDLFMGHYVVELGTSKNSVVENTKFVKAQDLWVPLEARARMDDTLPGGGYYKASYEIKLESILINPNHEALKSFSIDDIKDGARASIHGKPGFYSWQKGRLAPKGD
ncbi:MAG: hypothetical protein MUF81_12510 [Verrucomicrobia bacterium]|jgi:hypothetical protein|nr:hypothetical protein [Verrucomicrobiota bacterium]